MLDALNPTLSWFAAPALLALAMAIYAYHLRWARLVADRDEVAASISRLPCARQKRRRRTNGRRKESSWLTRRLVAKLGAVQGHDDGLRLRLLQAGYDSQMAYAIFRLLTREKFGIPWVALALGAPLGILVAVAVGYDTLTTVAPLALLAGMLFRRGIERHLVKRIASRKEALGIAAADFLSLLVITRAAGHATTEALRLVGNEMGTLYPELAFEIRLLLADFAIDSKRALTNLVQRIGDIRIYRDFARILRQDADRSTPIDADLLVLAGESRKIRAADAERKVRALPTKMTFMVPLLLLAIILVLAGPAVVNVSAALDMAGGTNLQAAVAPATSAVGR